MNNKEKEILKTILNDFETLEIKKGGDNTYYYLLVRGNLEDLIKGVYKRK